MSSHVLYFCPKKKKGVEALKIEEQRHRENRGAEAVRHFNSPLHVFTRARITEAQRHRENRGTGGGSSGSDRRRLQAGEQRNRGRRIRRAGEADGRRPTEGGRGRLQAAAAQARARAG